MEPEMSCSFPALHDRLRVVDLFGSTVTRVRVADQVIEASHARGSEKAEPGDLHRRRLERKSGSEPVG